MITWNEFKELVDKQLAENDKDGDLVQVCFIDVSYPQAERTDVTFDKNCLFIYSHS